MLPPHPPPSSNGVKNPIHFSEVRSPDSRVAPQLPGSVDDVTCMMANGDNSDSLPVGAGKRSWIPVKHSQILRWKILQMHRLTFSCRHPFKRHLHRP